jgi:hypothetical protein
MHQQDEIAGFVGKDGTGSGLLVLSPGRRGRIPFFCDERKIFHINKKMIFSSYLVLVLVILIVFDGFYSLLGSQTPRLAAIRHSGEGRNPEI